MKHSDPFLAAEAAQEKDIFKDFDREMKNLKTFIREQKEFWARLEQVRKGWK